MKELLRLFFPIKLHLIILQLEGYNYLRFTRWILKNFLVRILPVKKELKVTPKIKMILVLSVFWLLLFNLVIYFIAKSVFLNLFIFLVLLSQPYVLFGLALASLKPYEIIDKKRTIEKARQKITSNKKLKIIAVTGSYGKTATKEILYQLLKSRFQVLRTPESFNTIYGIAKAVNHELDPSYKYFICELAAYKKGEIIELCYMATPKFGVLTGIDKQHLERFGNLKNIIEAKFELLDYLKSPKKMIFNLDDNNIIEELKRRNIKNPNGYGLISKSAQVTAKNIRFSKKGSTFDLVLKGKVYNLRTRLFGYQSIKNILAATSVALRIGLKPNYITESIRELHPFPTRSELVITDQRKATLVDNTYSSNPAGFMETIKTAKVIKGRKVLVTPGLVELGQEEKVTHRRLGEKSRGIFDKVVLVGKNSRTQAFTKGLGINKQTEFIRDERSEYFQKIQEIQENFDWIFLENDITHNY